MQSGMSRLGPQASTRGPTRLPFDGQSRKPSEQAPNPFGPDFRFSSSPSTTLSAISDASAAHNPTSCASPAVRLHWCMCVPSPHTRSGVPPTHRRLLFRRPDPAHNPGPWGSRGCISGICCRCGRALPCRHQHRACQPGCMLCCCSRSLQCNMSRVPGVG